MSCRRSLKADALVREADKVQAHEPNYHDRAVDEGTVIELAVITEPLTSLQIYANTVQWSRPIDVWSCHANR